MTIQDRKTRDRMDSSTSDLGLPEDRSPDSVVVEPVQVENAPSEGLAAPLAAFLRRR
jgi:hypothetical protein